MSVRLSAVIITKNEARNIAACLKNVSFCEDIVVVDSESLDDTKAIALKAGARVFTQKFDNYAAQKNFALEQARGEWLFSIDADERVSEELKQALLSVASDEKNDKKGYAVRRENILYGKHLKRGACGDDYPIRLFRRGAAVFQGLVHEALNVQGEVGTLKQPLWHYSTANVRQHMAKLNSYSSLEAKRYQNEKKEFSVRSTGLRPILSFVYFFIFKGGFLDGMQGFLFAAISSYHEFVRRCKLWELRKNE